MTNDDASGIACEREAVKLIIRNLAAFFTAPGRSQKLFDRFRFRLIEERKKIFSTCFVLLRPETDDRAA